MNRLEPPSPPARALSGPLLTLLLCAIVALVIGGGLVAGADPSASPSDPASSTHGQASACPALAERYATQAPDGWRVECRPHIPDAWRAAAGDRPVASMSNRHEKLIVVVDGQSPEWTEASLAHEIAHAEASTWPPALRADFARAVGQSRWAGDQGPTTPVSVFAESSVRCRGLPIHVSYPLVPCTLVEAARSAGGATSPLPVTGDLPRS